MQGVSQTAMHIHKLRAKQRHELELALQLFFLRCCRARRRTARANHMKTVPCPSLVPVKRSHHHQTGVRLNKSSRSRVSPQQETNTQELQARHLVFNQTCLGQRADDCKGTPAMQKRATFRQDPQHQMRAVDAYHRRTTHRVDNMRHRQQAKHQTTMIHRNNTSGCYTRCWEKTNVVAASNNRNSDAVVRASVYGQSETIGRRTSHKAC